MPDKRPARSPRPARAAKRAATRLAAPKKAKPAKAQAQTTTAAGDATLDELMTRAEAIRRQSEETVRQMRLLTEQIQLAREQNGRA